MIPKSDADRRPISALGLVAGPGLWGKLGGNSVRRVLNTCRLQLAGCDTVRRLYWPWVLCLGMVLATACASWPTAALAPEDCKGEFSYKVTGSQEASKLAALEFLGSAFVDVSKVITVSDNNIIIGRWSDKVGSLYKNDGGASVYCTFVFTIRFDQGSILLRISAQDFFWYSGDGPRPIYDNILGNFKDTIAEKMHWFNRGLAEYLRSAQPADLSAGRRVR